MLSLVEYHLTAGPVGNARVRFLLNIGAGIRAVF